MKKLFALSLIVIHFQSYGQNLELMEVLEDFVIDENVSYNIQSWDVTENKEYSIEWENKDITWDKDKELYYKRGHIELGIDGEKFGSWEILQLGPKAGITKVSLYYPNDQRMGGIDIANLFQKRGIESSFIKCDENSPSYGFESWKIKPINKQKAWVSYEWSCGSAGCSAEVILHFTEDELKSYKCY